MDIKLIKSDYNRFLAQINAALLILFIKKSWGKKMFHGFHKNIKQQKQFSTLIIRTIINNWAPIIIDSN